MKLRKYVPWILLAAVVLLLASGMAWNKAEALQQEQKRRRQEEAVRTMVYEDLPVSEAELTDAPSVTVTLQEVNTEDKTITISLENTGDESYSRLPYLILDVEAGGKWRSVPCAGDEVCKQRQPPRRHGLDLLSAAGRSASGADSRGNR